MITKAFHVKYRYGG